MIFSSMYNLASSQAFHEVTGVDSSSLLPAYAVNGAYAQRATRRAKPARSVAARRSETVLVDESMVAIVPVIENALCWCEQ